MAQGNRYAEVALVFLFSVGGACAAQSQMSREKIEQGMREGEARVQQDKDGPKWKAAEQTCATKLGLPMVPKDAVAVARAYGSDKAIAYMDCFVDTMYPLRK